MIGAIYKQGQGYWTRVMSAIALGMLVLMGAYWVSDQFKSVSVAGYEPIYSQAVVFLIILAVFGWLGFHLIGRKPKVVDFMIATEGEMKKVNWSSRREILGSTWVVIAFTIFVAVLCFTFDRVFQGLFTWMGVLER